MVVMSLLKLYCDLLPDHLEEFNLQQKAENGFFFFKLPAPLVEWTYWILPATSEICVICCRYILIPTPPKIKQYYSSLEPGSPPPNVKSILCME